MKLCKDCKYALPEMETRLFLATIPNFRWAKCTQQERSPAQTNPVTGEITPAEYWFCSTQRNGIARTDCGPHALYWEPRT